MPRVPMVVLVACCSIAPTLRGQTATGNVSIPHGIVRLFPFASLNTNEQRRAGNAVVTAFERAANFATHHRSEFLDAVRMRSSDPQLADRDVNARQEAAVAVREAQIASDDSLLTEQMKSVPPTQQSAVDSTAAVLRKALREAQLRAASPWVQVFADGDLRGATQQGSDTGEHPPIGSGSLGVSITSAPTSWVGKMTIASTQEVMTGDFGTFLLSPSSGRPFNSGLLDFRWRVFGMRSRPFLHGYVTAARARWQLKSDGDAQEATMAGGGLLLGYSAGMGTVGENQVSLNVGAGPSFRHLGGAISDSANKQLRSDVLKSDATGFGGGELGVELTFGRITGAVQYYHYRGSFAGVSHGNVIAAFNIAGSIFEGTMKEIFK